MFDPHAQADDATHMPRARGVVRLGWSERGHVGAGPLSISVTDYGARSMSGDDPYSFGLTRLG